MSGRAPEAGITFTRFERFWHWTQTGLILALLATGFGMYGTHALFDFGTAMSWHLVFAWALIGLWLLAIFWHLFTGQWRQYVPARGVLPMLLHYLYGIFSGEALPYRTTPSAKHNPLQRLAYLGFKLLIAPALWITGLLMLFYPAWQGTSLGELLRLAGIAWIHVAAAYGLVLFLVVHIYISATTGHPWYSHLAAMITGREATAPDPATPGHSE